MIRYVELCGGIGGFGRALSPLVAQCVLFCELDRYARQTWAANNSSAAIIHDDIGSLAAEDVPEHDLLMAGFPCQPWSSAGTSKRRSLGRSSGMADELQGTLIFEILRIIAYHNPRLVILENVVGLLSQDGGSLLVHIHDELAACGYVVQWRILDAIQFVPQSRKRIFIVGQLGYPVRRLANLYLPNRRLALQSILEPAELVDARYGLSTRLWIYLQDYRRRQQARGNGFGYSLVGPDDTARTLSARYAKDGSEILVRRPGNTPRRLTPRECARLMGFELPGGYAYQIPVSDTQAYRQFGNAVVVPLVRHLLRYLMDTPIRFG